MALTISRSFRDISLSFSRHPVTNDVLTIKNEDAIKKSVINLVRTNIGERFFNRLLGTTINDSLFELQSQELSILIEEEIKTLLTNYEPRIKINYINVIVDYDSNDLGIELVYDIVGQGFPKQQIEFILQPTRA
jgi:phage baseplate assembly protein W